MPRVRVQLFLLAVFVLVFPYFIRRRPRVERRITICAPPEEIFPMVNKLQNWPLWTPWSERKEIAFSYGEIIEGQGALQRWRDQRSGGTLRITRSEPDQRVDYALEMHGGKTRFLGRFDFVPDGACTRVRWRCVWEPARNPYMRYLDLFFRWRITRDFARGLEKLRESVERRVPPSIKRAA